MTRDGWECWQVLVPLKLFEDDKQKVYGMVVDFLMRTYRKYGWELDKWLVLLAFPTRVLLSTRLYVMIPNSWLYNLPVVAVAVIVYNSTIIIDQSFHTSNFLLLAVVNSNILSNHHPTSNNIFQTTKSNVLRGFDHHKSQSFPASAPKKCRTCRITCPLRNLKMLAGQSHNNPAQNYCQFFQYASENWRNHKTLYFGKYPGELHTGTKLYLKKKKTENVFLPTYSNSAPSKKVAIFAFRDWAWVVSPKSGTFKMHAAYTCSQCSMV